MNKLGSEKEDGKEKNVFQRQKEYCLSQQKLHERMIIEQGEQKNKTLFNKAKEVL